MIDKKRTVYECIEAVYMALGVGICTGKEWSINEISKTTGICWETCKRILELLFFLGMVNRVEEKTRWRYRMTRGEDMMHRIWCGQCSKVHEVCCKDGAESLKWYLDHMRDVHDIDLRKKRGVE